MLRGHPGENPVEVAFSRQLAYGEHQGAHSVLFQWLAAHVPYVSSNQALALGIVLILYAGLFAAQTIGIWLEALWGELLVIFETAAFLPIEVWHIVHGPKPFQFVALTVNLLILGYLLRKYQKRREETAGHRPHHGRSAYTP